MTPIGYFSSKQSERYALPRQPGAGIENCGLVTLEKQRNFEQALEDLKGFDRIWLIYQLHRNSNWKPKVMPPRGEKKRGLFATRSPHRPNPIGLSCVELIKVEGLHIWIGNHDLLDGSPILDIKPYIAYSDSFPDASQGWLEELEEPRDWEIEFSLVARKQIETIKASYLEELIISSLKKNPLPNRHNRIKKRANEANSYELAIKEWRVDYEIKNTTIFIKELRCGYSLMPIDYL